MKFLLYGGDGWIGTFFQNWISENSKNPNSAFGVVSDGPIEIISSKLRVDDVQAVKEELSTLKPDRVLSFIGRTWGPGFNNIDYLEQPGKLVDNLRDNLYSPLILMKLCEASSIHLTYIGTGCIFDYDSKDEEILPIFHEDSKPCFFGSSYSIVKGFTDQITKLFPNVLNVRLRMPICSYDHPKNLLSKLIRYQKVYNSKNSVTVLEDCIPALFSEILKERVGTIHLTNQGYIDHQTILELYKKHVDPNHKYEIISEEEHNSILAAKRSKCILESSFSLPFAVEAIDKIFKEWKNQKKSG